MSMAQQLVLPNRPLRVCPVCGKEGYLYKRTRPSGHSYVYCCHFNEEPIKYVDGKPKYRWCYSKSRVYGSLEEMYQSKRKSNRIRSPDVVCPKCGKDGRLCKFPDRTRGGGIRYMVTHDKKHKCYLKKHHIAKLENES